ncbi:hypothetical protein J5U22_02261 [Saccharolobus shibatae]|uniref:Uncharacterized protein n=1 Tax=Saccharolobus shibatae TaxID=2286 RepID=A0A8F5GZV3_9CREN|nr:hypothetical protein J5U22_02261 [Saccharolobus shibatae]
MKIGINDLLLALSNRYVKVLRYVLLWLKENCKINPTKKGVKTIIHQDVLWTASIFS